MTPTKKKVIGAVATLLAAGAGLWAWRGRGHAKDKHHGDDKPGDDPHKDAGSSTSTQADAPPADAPPAPTPPADATPATTSEEETSTIVRQLGPEGTAWTREAEVLVQHGSRVFNRVQLRRPGHGIEYRWFDVTSRGGRLPWRHAPAPVVVERDRAHGWRR